MPLPSNVLINSSTLQALGVNYTSGPVPSGAKTITMQLQFNAATSYIFDPNSAIQTGAVLGIQGVFVDCSGTVAGTSQGPMTISLPSAGQVIIVPQGSQGWYPLLLTKNDKPVFSCITAGVIPVTLVNFPVTTHNWFTNSASAPQFVQDLILEDAVSAGKFQVQDVSAESFLSNISAVASDTSAASGTAIPNSTNAVMTFVQASGSILRLPLRANQLLNLALTTSGTTNVLTAPIGYYVTSLSVRLTSTATITGGGPLVITFSDSGGGPTLFTFEFYVGTAAITATGVAPKDQTPDNFFFNNSVNGSGLNVAMSATLATGSALITVNYGFINYVG